jgi:hypothetical protein
VSLRRLFGRLVAFVDRPRNFALLLVLMGVFGLLAVWAHALFLIPTACANFGLQMAIYGGNPPFTSRLARALGIVLLLLFGGFVNGAVQR